MSIYSSQQTVFTENFLIYAGADFLRNFTYEDKTVDIGSFSVGATTTITTSAPHLLTTAGYVNLRGITGSEDINDSFEVTVTSPTEFTIDFDSTGLTLTGGTANRPVNLTGWTLGGEVRSAVSQDPGGSGGVVASISGGDLSAVLLEGQHSFVVGDELSIAGAGLTNAKILSISASPTQGVARINASAANAVSRVAVTRNTRLVATFTCTVVNPLTGEFSVSLAAATTLAIAPPSVGSSFYFDVKYKAGGIVNPLLKGQCQVEPLVTQATL